MKGEYNTKSNEKEHLSEKNGLDFVEIDIVDKPRRRPTLTFMSPDELPGSLALSTEKLLDGDSLTDYSSISDSQKGYGATVVESDKKIPYPKSVFFIITNEFCERFSYYGMKAVLGLFLINVLGYSEDKSTVVYHVFSMLCYFTPVFGAMIADSLLGKFKTILYLSIVYAIGNVVLSLAATPPLQIPTETFSMLGLLLIAIGTGGIKPCVSAFGGDQFTLPQQALQLSSFFSIFYFSINAGSLLSTFITPIFRKDVQCFGAETCYPLAFGVPAVLMVVSLVVFVIGRPWYTCRKPEGNITMDVAKCVTHAISQKSKSNIKREHWLDHASGKYDSELIESVKRLLKILVLYIPLPVFWALFDQQGSRWTFQATRMDGEVFGYIIKPDQMQVLNPFLILAFIPIFDQIIYPGLAKIGLLKKPLQRLTVGGVLAGVAFVVSGILELQLEPTYAVKLGANEAHVNFINGLPCPVKMELEGNNSTQIEAFGQHILKQIEAGKTYATKFTPAGEGCESYKPFDYQLNARNKEARSYLIMSEGTTASIKEATSSDKLKKDGEGASKIKFVFLGFGDSISRKESIQFKHGDSFMKVWQEPEVEDDGHGKKVAAVSVDGVPVSEFDSGNYKTDPHEQTLVLMTPAIESKDISKKYVTIGNIKPKQGGNYVYVIKKESGADKFDIKEYVITQPNSIHMLWLVPQYVIITIGEVMFSVTGLQFAFSQAPATMKSVLQAAWLLTVAFGNVIVVFLAEFKIFEEQSKEFFLYSGLMFVDMIIFAVLACFYKPVEIGEVEDPDNNTVEMRESSPGRRKNEEYKDA